MSDSGMTAFCGAEGCMPFEALGGAAGGATLGLGAPVGSAARCRNAEADVRKVQQALNRFTPPEGGPSPALVEDGKLGPLTMKGITGFQKKHFGLGGADGVVDPGKKTDKELCSAAGTYPDLPAEMMKHRARAMYFIGRARSSISIARYYQAHPDNRFGTGKSDWDKLATHFQIDRFPGANGWRDALDWINGIYVSMETAIGHVPQGLVLTRNEPAHVGLGAYAFAFTGGYDVSARSQTVLGMSKGSIYLCPRMQNLDGDAFAYVLIHEAAHFVGPMRSTHTAILDHGYAHHTDGRYKKLLPWQRTHNADCYSQFAFAAAGVPFDLNAHLLVKQ
jgi:hypothetical protein